MKISILTEKKDWICRRAAEELCKHIPNCTINRGSEYKYADIVYALPYTVFPQIGSVSGKVVSLFTHFEYGNEAKEQAWFQAEDGSDAIVYMSLRNYGMGGVEGALGYRLAKIEPAKGTPHTVPVREIHWGSDITTHDPTFGIVGNVTDLNSPSKCRKRPQFAEWLIQDGFDLLINGKGWLDGCSLDDVSWGGRKDFYQNIDYLIITSELEGGPVPVLDALACNVPVIAPDVGWCWDYPVIRYDGNYKQLREICTKLCSSRTWKDFAREHELFFREVLDGSL